MEKVLREGLTEEEPEHPLAHELDGQLSVRLDDRVGDSAFDEGADRNDQDREGDRHGAEGRPVSVPSQKSVNEQWDHKAAEPSAREEDAHSESALLVKPVPVAKARVHLRISVEVKRLNEERRPTKGTSTRSS